MGTDVVGAVVEGHDVGLAAVAAVQDDVVRPADAAMADLGVVPEDVR
jgi:hypothetical protein